MAEVATISKVTFNTSLSLNGVQRCRHVPGLRTMLVRGDGQLSPTRAYIQGISPAIEVATLDVATALALNTAQFATKGLALSAAFNGYLTQRTADGGLAATGDKLAMGNGLIVPTRLSVRNEEAAVLDIMVHGRSSDGTTNPLSVTADQSVPAGSAITACHTVGKLMVNGAQIAANLIQGFDWDFGVTVRAIGGDGLLYPTRLHIVQVQPRLSWEVSDADALAAIGLAGTAQGATDSLFYLRKFDPNGGRVADGTAEHVKLSIDDGLWWVEEAAGDTEGDVSVRLVCEPVWDATAEPVVVSIAAIT